MGMGGQCHALAALPPGMPWYSLYRRLGGPQGWSGQVWKMSPPPGFDPWTVQSVASHYTDYAILAHTLYIKPEWMDKTTSDVCPSLSHCCLSYTLISFLLRVRLFKYKTSDFHSVLKFYDMRNHESKLSRLDSKTKWFKFSTWTSLQCTIRCVPIILFLCF